MSLPRQSEWARNGALVLSAVIATAALSSGCRRGDTARQRATANRTAQQGATQRNALLDTIRSQLRSLPERTSLELRPPTVVLDARNSTDGEEIVAALLRRPGAPPIAPANLIRVPSGNSDFKRVVRPGDQLKYFVVLDDATRQRFQQGDDVDIATFNAKDFVVAQVLSDRELLVEGGLVQPIDGLFKVEVWRVDDDRMQEISRDLNSYFEVRRPPLGWQPSPDQLTINRLTERLNQWLRQAAAGADDWAPSALLASLPDAVTANQAVKQTLSPERLATGLFTDDETRAVQGAIWRRDVARWARGSDPAPLAVAERLNEWVAKNLQLAPDEQSPPRWPWELMLHGKATAEGRAWVLVGLLEQLNIAAGVVSIPGEGDTLWPLAGVLDGDRLCLFDPALGAPLRTSDGKVASLSDLRGDDSIARALDLPDAPYPVSASAAAEAVVGVVAAPTALTRRAALLEKRLTGDDAVVLAADADALAERLEQADGVDKVVLWPIPQQTLADMLEADISQRRRAVREFVPFAWRPRLWKARAQHLRGEQQQRTARTGPLEELRDDHREAARLYLDPAVRPSNARLETVSEDKRVIYRQAKTLATLWLGMLAAEQGDHAVAIDWFGNAVFDHPDAKEHRPAVAYNTALSHAQLGQTDEAIALLRSIDGPMSHGARLIANRLVEGKDQPASEEVAAE